MPRHVPSSHPWHCIDTGRDDHDPLDILVICSIDVYPKCIVEVKIIGAKEMVDGEERDDKIIAVAGNDMSVNYINDLSELPPHTFVELKRFFEDYKMLEHKNVIVEQFMNREKAYEIILESMRLYQAKREMLMQPLNWLTKDICLKIQTD